MSVQMGSAFRTGRATKGASQPGLAAVPARCWHRIKASSESRPPSPLGGPRKERRYDKNPAGGGSRQTP